MFGLPFVNLIIQPILHSSFAILVALLVTLSSSIPLLS